MMSVDPERRQLLTTLGAGAVGLAGLTAGLIAANSAAFSSSRSVFAALEGPRAWLGSAPLGAGALAGKVVLVNFWTYSCINSLRPLPYLRAWAQKYAGRGLVVIGVHTPEFAFEHDITKVERAIEAQQVVFPVVLDNEYEVWNAFANNAWPGFYFVDAGGRVRHRVLGEGDYDRSERFIQQLLSETGVAADDAILDVRGEGVQAPPNWSTLRSPETYVGYRQASNFVSRGGLREGTPALYEHAPSPRLNQWSLSGAWTAGEEYATTDAQGAAIRFRFHARDLHMVLGRARQSAPVPFRVTIDGAALGADRGVDTDADGRGILGEDRMYQLVRQTRPIEDRTVEVEFSGPGARAYVFTFG
jgi:thiol-disulfide isomerase/thioredoxin